MAKHRVGDRRIISVSIPEDIARRLDARVGKGRGEGRSATISKMIENSLLELLSISPTPARLSLENRIRQTSKLGLR